MPKWINNPFVYVPLVGLILGLIIFFLQRHELSRFLIVTIVAFFLSDIISAIFVRGGRGAPQIPPLGTRIRPKGQVFIALFLSILFVALAADKASELAAAIVLSRVKDLTVDLAVGLLFSILVYLDMNAKLYSR